MIEDTKNRGALGIVVILGLVASFASAQNFSTQNGGPGGVPGSAIQEKDGDTITTVGGGPGTGTPNPEDDIDALSGDQPEDKDDDGVTFCFSVDSNADGVILFVPGINVPHQALRNQEAGDAFITTEAWDLVLGLLPPPVSLGEFDNVLITNQGRGWGDATGFGLVPDVPPLQFVPPNVPIDNLDALADLDPGVGGPPEAFFTLRNGSPSLETLPGPPSLNRGADIFFDPNIQQGGNEQLFAQTQQLGLQLGDDIDGLVVLDRNDNRTYEPDRDVIVFSLAPGSPTLVQNNLSPADVFMRAPGTLQVLGTFNQIGLGFDDNLDALHFDEVLGTVEETIRSKLPPAPKVAIPKP